MQPADLLFPATENKYTFHPIRRASANHCLDQSSAATWIWFRFGNLFYYVNCRTGWPPVLLLKM